MKKINYFVNLFLLNQKRKKNTRRKNRYIKKRNFIKNFGNFFLIKKKNSLMDLDIESKNKFMVNEEEDEEDVHIENLNEFFEEDSFKPFLFSNDFSFNEEEDQLLKKKNFEFEFKFNGPVVRKRKRKYNKMKEKKKINFPFIKKLKRWNNHFLLPKYKAIEGARILKYWKKIKKEKLLK